MKVMSAIETCRTAALGGRVERCEDCAHTRIAYTCRNRQCPKRQDAAARQWLEGREAELLPVPCYHVVFALPAAIGAIAFQNKAMVYDLLFRTAAEMLTAIAAEPKHLGARIGHRHAAHPGLAANPSFPCPGHRPRRRPVAGRLTLDRLQEPGRLTLFGDLAPLADKRDFDAAPARLRRSNWVVFAKRTFAGPQAVLAYLARYTHRVAISNS